MMAGFLNLVFDPLDYCEFYACQDHRRRPLPCPSSSWPSAMRLGCRAGHMVQKNHDFDLSLPISDAFRYVVSLRHPLYSLTSWYTLWCKTAPPGTVIEPFAAFMLGKADYWREFARKWADAPPRANVLVNRYEDMIRDPEETRRVATFINGDTPPPGLSRLDDATFHATIRQDRDLTTEASTDPSLFKEVQERIGLDLMRRLGFEELTFEPSP
jgi:hypothetical protein